MNDSDYLPKVTSIPDGAFKEFGNIEEVYIPEGVVEIGANAFYGCKNLKYVHLPSTLKSIGSYAFEFTQIEHLIIPRSVVKIGTLIVDQIHIKSIVFEGTQSVQKPKSLKIKTGKND